jgi:DNA-binding MarR family transcriptional regulator
MDETELYRLLSFVQRSSQRVAIVRYLYTQEGPQTPSTIAQATSIHRNHVSNQLTNLLSHELVKILNPEAPFYRYYRLTDTGQTVAKELIEREQKQ